MGVETGRLSVKLKDDPVRHSEESPTGIPRNVKAVAPNANVYVYRIPAVWIDRDLYECFQRFGNIVSVSIARHPDGSSRGYGFVGYDDARSANAAVGDLNGFKVDGSTLTVRIKDEGP